jgi:hypothetical protein
VRDMKGLHYVRFLVQRPGRDVPALELVEGVTGNPAAVQADLGATIDRQAIAAYRRRLGDLDDELAAAEADADGGRIARAGAEREALLHHLRAAAGLGGRQRLAGSTGERARVAVRKAIAAAVERVAGVDPAVGRLLRDGIRTGASCRYEPDPGRPVEWVLDLS